MNETFSKTLTIVAFILALVPMMVTFILGSIYYGAYVGWVLAEDSL